MGDLMIVGWSAFLAGMVLAWGASRFSKDGWVSAGFADGVKSERQNGVMAMINSLREGEGSAVTICADNPDFEGENCCITVMDGWTNWNERTFYGDTVHHCLSLALAARDVSKLTGTPT